MRFGVIAFTILPPSNPLAGALPEAGRRRVCVASRGMTLVELLVVIVIVTTLLTTALPVISPSGDTRKLREASRNLNAYLSGAQARAVQTGRPFGVSFNRLSAQTERGADNAVCTLVTPVEVPPAYAGFDESSRCRIGVIRGANNVKQLALQFLRYSDEPNPGLNDGLPPGHALAPPPPRFFRPGDRIVVAGIPYEFEDPTDQVGVQVLGNLRAVGYEGVVQVGPESPDRPTVYLDGGAALERGGWFYRVRPIASRPGDGRLGFGNEGRLSVGFGGGDLAFSHDAFGEPIDYEAASRAAVSDSDDADRYNILWVPPTPYVVERQLAPANTEPLQLPAGTAIDLAVSHFDETGDTAGSRLTLSDRVSDETLSGASPAVRSDPISILFSPSGTIFRWYRDSGGTAGVTGEPIASSLLLCVGRRELVSTGPSEYADPDFGGPADPIDLSNRTLQQLSEEERREVTDQYNWLNTDTRWVVVNPQSGVVSTISNASIGDLQSADRNNDNRVTFAEQIAAATLNARLGVSASER